MVKHIILRKHYFLIIFLLFGCKAYKQDILFRLDDQFTSADLSEAVSRANSNYELQTDDRLRVEVFTNEGERLIDPNFELMDQQNNQMVQQRTRYEYLIQADGSVKLPMVGKKNLTGLTIDEAEKILEQGYKEHYVDPFVKLSVINRRVIVLGANGGQVIPIENENTSIVEVLALYGGLNLGAKAHNIKLIRGDLSNPQVFQIDLATLHGMKSSVVAVESEDIIYVEPWRRPWLESLRDVTPILGLTTSVLTLIVVIQNLSN
ncbi:MAG: polysaccharide biosynthesis/export family protein [Cyclobacteriaceae bacterium]|nr:polysaccharide biosynthesis/export family protein [Cyclobacteriaceae bacterium SS2]